MFELIGGANIAMLYQTGIIGAIFIIFTFITFKPLIKFLEYLVHKVVELNKITAQHEARVTERKKEYGKEADGKTDSGDSGENRG